MKLKSLIFTLLITATTGASTGASAQGWILPYLIEGVVSRDGVEIELAQARADQEAAEAHYVKEASEIMPSVALRFIERISRMEEIQTDGQTSTLFRQSFGFEFSGPNLAKYINNRIKKVIYSPAKAQVLASNYSRNPGLEYVWGLNQTFLKENRSSIAEWATLVHEARHSDDLGEIDAETGVHVGGHAHATCPRSAYYNSHHLTGEAACESDPRGSYIMAAIFANEIYRHGDFTAGALQNLVPESAKRERDDNLLRVLDAELKAELLALMDAE